MTGMAEGQRSGAGPDFDAPGLARHLLRTVRSGALATLDPEGAPHASLVTVATAPDGAPLFLMSRLSAHTRHLDRDPRASLLLSSGGRGDPLAHPRLTLGGSVRRSDDGDVRRRFLARQPKAALYADFGDFGFFRMAIASGHLNGGFARAAGLVPADLLTDLGGAEDLLAAEAGAVDHMNRDHAEALALYATRLAGAAAGRWRTSGIDPDGIDLQAGDRTARVPFPERVTEPGSLRRTLAALARRARGATP